MTTHGILSRGTRKEKNWSGTRFSTPYSKAVDRFRREVNGRSDFDPSTLLVWGTYMAMSVLQIMNDVEENFGPEGQKVVSGALRKIGYDAAKQMFEHAHFPEGTSDIEKVSFVTTQINTVTWSSIEKPKIISKDEALFGILWCPHQDIYKPFDCRVQRYLVEGMLNYLHRKIDPNFDLEFKWIIPAGAETCRFRIWKRKEGEEDHWEEYSKKLGQRALGRCEPSKDKESHPSRQDVQ
jgi:hypothetical protein